MRFAPWMLAPSSKARAGLWRSLPEPVLAALNSSDQSPMVRAYLLNGSWSGLTKPNPDLVATGQIDKLPPEQEPEPTPTAEHSSLVLTLRVVQPAREETVAVDIPPKESRLRRFWRAMKGKAA